MMRVVAALLLFSLPLPRAVRDEDDETGHTAEYSLRVATQSFNPKAYELDSLGLETGDHVRVTHNPQHRRHKAYRGNHSGFAYGYNPSTLKNGWFPLTATEPVASSLGEVNGEGPTYSAEECSNSYFADWGSSGMKFYKVHVGSKIFTQSKDDVKEKEIIGTISEDFFEEKLTEYANLLNEKGNAAPNTWRTYATAGLRIHVENADRLWHHLRYEMSEKAPFTGLLAECDRNTDAGCKTLPGSAEALYEFGAYYMNSPGIAERDSLIGFVSAGGASLQIGVAGASQEAMERCHLSLTQAWAGSGENPVHDANPTRITDLNGMARLPGGGELFLMSFLAIGGFDVEAEQADHQVGGVNEMRKQFEHFLIRTGHQSNPCLEQVIGQARLPLEFGSDVFSETLPGSLVGLAIRGTDHEGHGIEKCHVAVNEFLETDVSLKAWKDGGCYEMVKPIQKWGFMTSFSRLHGHKFGINVHRDLCSEKNFNQPYKCGTVLTNVLLAGFLEHVGFDLFDVVEESSADWVESPMMLNGIKNGWCP